MTDSRIRHANEVKHNLQTQKINQETALYLLDMYAPANVELFLDGKIDAYDLRDRQATQ